MHPLVEDKLVRLLEAGLAAWPRRRPSVAQLEQAVIVAHRGERDGLRVRENTLAAFDPVVEAGVGAIEFDIRYTRDDEPVVIHDADLKRVFGDSTRIDAMDWRTVRARTPELPHLVELIERYADRTHLMIELKARGSETAEQRLHDALDTLRPSVDYHLLSLDPALFEAASNVPSETYIPVAKTNWRPMLEWARANDCGGIAGFFALIRQDEIDETRRVGQNIGSGFITRRGVLMREISRNVPWIFTNRPLALQRMLEQALARAKAY